MHRRTDTDTIAGEEQTVPVHATVIIFGRSPGRWQLTMTAGSGYSMFPGLKYCFAMNASPFAIFLWAPVCIIKMEKA